MKTLAIIQARMGSTRLPGKVMMNLCSYPMIYWVIKGTSEAKLVDKVVVATSTNTEDILIKYVESLGVDVFRGDEKNILDRYVQCARQHTPENVVRITGDCPLINPLIIDLVIEEHELCNTDYTSNVFPIRTYPKGLDVEVMTYETLYYLWSQSLTDYEEEHVTAYIHHHPKEFRIGNVRFQKDISHLQWSVDTQEDFDRVEEILTCTNR
jgi:spore coat polysaccharide biosynthesis protein SpsF (cytidylyltransferase family)